MNFGVTTVSGALLLLFGFIGAIDSALGIYEKLHHRGESCDK
jgi:hypothetical protein